MQTKTFGILSSSVDPTQLSATVSGAILSASAFIIWVAGTYFHVTIGSADVSMAATQLGLAAGSLWFVFGVVRKAVVWVQQQYAASKNPATNAAQQ